MLKSEDCCLQSLLPSRDRLPLLLPEGISLCKFHLVLGLLPEMIQCQYNWQGQQQAAWKTDRPGQLPLYW